MSRLDDKDRFDQTAEAEERAGMTREAAREQMARFRGVDAYSARKIFGRAHKSSAKPAPKKPVQDPLPFSPAAKESAAS